MVEKLISMNLTSSGKVIFTDESRRLIHRIAENSSDIPIIEETRDMANDYADGLTAEQVYTDMLHKIINAPNSIYMRMSALMLIAVVDRKLTESRAD